MGILTNNSAVNNHTFRLKMKYNISLLKIAIKYLEGQFKARQVTFSSPMKDNSNPRRGFIEV